MLDAKSMGALLDAFVAETTEGLAEAEQALLKLERAPESSGGIAHVFRVVHTVKGNAGIFEFVAVTTFAHAMEDLLDRLRVQTEPVSSANITLLLHGVDALRTLVVDSIAGPRELSAAERTLIGEFTAALSAKAARKSEPEHEVAAPVHTREVKRTLRVDVARLDRLLDLSGEIGIARGRVMQLLGDPSASKSAALEAQRDSMLLHMEMQELIMSLRMIPVGATFRQLLRTVRDTARALGKQAELFIEGEDVEVDMAVVEQLKDPLMHMARNAVDHGIELPGVRTAAGKATTGRLSLRSFREAGSILIELEDDGAGLDRDRIVERARERGLLDRGESLSDEEVHELIFRPGFSTAQQVSGVSGRGVGLDVVRRNIEAIHGTVSVSSVSGSGTTISIRLPLTLAIIEGLQIGVGGESYIIPMEAVVEAVDVPRNPLYDGESTGLVQWRDEDIPFIRLRQRLGFTAIDSKAANEHVVVVRYSDRGRAALVVDELFGECQTVVKPLARLIQGITGVSGSAILPDGKIAFIVDVPDLLQSETARARRSRSEAPASSTTSSSAGRPMSALTMN